MWIALVLTLTLVAFVGAVFWSAWEPFSRDLNESAALKIPVVGVLALVVLVPPLAWAMSAVD
jgi:TRAP-type C4-dicarboxylate transport system permease small subunit